jgi:hypothetical protein
MIILHNSPHAVVVEGANIIDFCIEYMGGNMNKWRIKMTAINPRRTQRLLGNGQLPECHFRANNFAVVLRTTGKKLTEVAENVGAEVINDGFNNNYFYFNSVDHAKQFIEGLSRWLVPLRLMGYRINTTVNSYDYQG